MVHRGVEIANVGDQGACAPFLEFTSRDPETGPPDPRLRVADGGASAQRLRERLCHSVAGDFRVAAKREQGAPQAIAVLADGSGLQQVSPPDVQVDTVAAWSPDGSQIVFETSASEELHGELWIVNADGSSPHELAITPECGGPFSDASATGCFDPAWSPDGTQIVFARSSADGSQNIYIVNVDGTELVQVTDGDRDHQPDWGTPPTAN